MAGIYIHIPFCRQACHYCDFHFSTNLKNQDDMVRAICQEVDMRADYIGPAIQTIYFGGGTPSLLSIEQLSMIMKKLQRFDIADDAEITFEANPEDLTTSYCDALKSTGINRLSIGFQTFDSERLQWMNRVHDADQARRSFEVARKAGFENVSIDLIYALPNTRPKHWLSDLTAAVALDPEHISLYGLTIEDRTVFGKRKQQGALVELPEDEAAGQYLEAIDLLKARGFDHYEVSNFGKPGFHSRHNGGYWTGLDYLGIGPGAHSYNGKTRQFNVRNNAKYIKSIAGGASSFEVEYLTQTQLLNEHILTGLRRADGISLVTLQSKFGVNLLEAYSTILDGFERQGLITREETRLNLTSKGFLVADDIALQLFFDE